MKSKLTRLLSLFFAISFIQSIAIIGLYTRVARLSEPQNKAITGLDRGIKAPDFTLMDTSENEVSLYNFAGQKVLLMFASTKCHACLDMFPTVEKFSNRHHNIEVVVVITGSSAEIRDLEQKYKFGNSLPLWNDEIQKNYKVKATPYFYSIDSTGVILGSGVANSLSELERLTSEDI